MNNKALRIAMIWGSIGVFSGVTLAHEMTEAQREKKLDKMATELSLTQDQKNQIRTIKDDKYQKIEAAEKEADDKIRGVLNPDQQAKFDKIKEHE